MSQHATAHDAHDAQHHVSPVSLYLTVWIGLMILTAVTVLAYYVPIWLNVSLGAANIVIAMAIATVKASLVAWYFMHLRHDKKFHLLAFLSSLIFLGLFLTFTLLDINTREDQPAFAKPSYEGKMPASAEHAGGEKKEGEAKEGKEEAKPEVKSEAKPEAKSEAKPVAPATSAAGATKH